MFRRSACFLFDFSCAFLPGPGMAPEKALPGPKSLQHRRGPRASSAEKTRSLEKKKVGGTLNVVARSRNVNVGPNRLGDSKGPATGRH